VDTRHVNINPDILPECPTIGRVVPEQDMRTAMLATMFLAGGRRLSVVADAAPRGAAAVQGALVSGPPFQRLLGGIPPQAAHAIRVPGNQAS